MWPFSDAEANTNLQQESLVSRMDESMGLSGHYEYFVICFTFGGFLMFLSLFFILSIPTSPGKFASLNAVGSLCMMFSFAFIKGLGSCLSGTFDGDRIWYAFGYCGALFITFVASMLSHNYFLAFVGAVAQIYSVSYLLCSFVPGGVTGLKYLCSASWSCIKQTCSSCCG